MNAIKAVSTLLDNVSRDLNSNDKLVRRTDGLIDGLRKELNDISRISDELDRLREDYKDMDLGPRAPLAVATLKPIVMIEVMPSSSSWE